LALYKSANQRRYLPCSKKWRA